MTCSTPKRHLVKAVQHVRIIAGCCTALFLAAPVLAAAPKDAGMEILPQLQLERQTGHLLLVKGGNGGNGGGHGGGSGGGNGNGGGGHGAGDGTGNGGDGPADGTGYGPGTGDCVYSS